jgi:NADH-quinone oxidoreductase subunit G
MRGDEVYRVTARKDQWGEVEEWICNDCRFHKKEVKDWVIEGPSKISRSSVISQGHYVDQKKQPVLIDKVIGKNPKLLLDIHKVSDVNRPEIELSKIDGPAHSNDFKPNK